MKVKAIWPKCKVPLWDEVRTGSRRRIDCYWIVCTSEELEQKVMPFLSEEAKAKLNKRPGLYVHPWHRIRYEHLSKVLPTALWYFLVAKDLSHIRPTTWHYPFHQLWDAYSPFKALNEDVVINDLSELATIEVDVDWRDGSFIRLGSLEPQS